MPATFGLNYNEACRSVKRSACKEATRMKIPHIATEMVGNSKSPVVHPSIGNATKEGAWWSEGPFTENPKTPPEQGLPPMPVSARSTWIPPQPLFFCHFTSGHYVRSTQSPSTNQVIALLKEAELSKSRVTITHFLRRFGGLWKIHPNPPSGGSARGDRSP